MVIIIFNQYCHGSHISTGYLLMYLLVMFLPFFFPHMAAFIIYSDHECYRDAVIATCFWLWSSSNTTAAPASCCLSN